ncbi:MAG: O-antigen ligase family protein [bacterium]|nr:O-antigen ligase family protein [bacterium]
MSAAPIGDDFYIQRRLQIVLTALVVSMATLFAIKTDHSIYWSLALFGGISLTAFSMIVRPTFRDFLFFTLPLIAVAANAFVKTKFPIIAALWLFGLAIYYLFQFYANNFKIITVRPYFSRLLILFVLVVLNSIFFAPFGSYTFNGFFNIMIFIVAYWLLVQILSGSDFKRLLTFTFFGFLTGSFVYLLALGIRSPTALLPFIAVGILRPEVMGISANEWSYYPAIGCLMALAFIFYGGVRGISRLFWVGAAILLFGIAFITMSRTALLGIGVTTLFIFGTHPRGRKTMVILGSLGLIAFLVTLPIILPWLMLLLRVKAGLSGRGPIWSSALEILIQHPVTGLGPEQFIHWLIFEGSLLPEGLRVYAGGLSAHNAFFNTGIEIGLLGLAIMLTIFILFARRCWKLWPVLKSTPDFIVLVIISSLGISGFIRCIFEATFFVPTTYIYKNITMILILALQDRLCHRYLPEK